jgi:hypothetical protein
METYKDNNAASNQMEDKKRNQIHLEELGLNIPEGYFAQSKNEILTKTSERKRSKIDVFFIKNTAWKVAASITLLMGATIYFQYSSKSISESELAEITTSPKIEDKTLVQSDTSSKYKNIDTKMKYGENVNVIPKNVVQNENDILVKSLFVEDDEVDSYIDNYILEDI